MSPPAEESKTQGSESNDSDSAKSGLKGSTTTTQGERRSNYRGRASLGRRVDVTYSRKDGKELQGGGLVASSVTGNIGVGGAFLLSEKAEEVGSELQLRVHIPSRSDAIEIEGEVRWVRSSPDPGMGLRFADLPVQTLLALREYLSSRL